MLSESGGHSAGEKRDNYSRGVLSHFFKMRNAGFCLKSDLLIFTITQRWLGRIWECVTALAAHPALVAESQHA